MFSLAFPPFAVDSSPGQTSFLGWHSLFTQDTGYVSVSRLLLFWLLVFAVAGCVQVSGEHLLRGAPTRPAMVFGRQDGHAPFSRTAVLAIALALPTWFFLSGLALGRSRILGLESHLAYFACVAFQLVVLSRLLVWISRDRNNLQFGYAILCAASVAWDLRTSPSPEARVAGLVPLYLILGYLLYRFDLRFAEPAKPVVPAPAADPPAEATPAQLAPPPAEEAAPPQPPEAIPDPPSAPAEPAPVSTPPPLRSVQPEAESAARALRSPSESPETSVAPNTPAAEDPYHRYRPKK
jgi:hypothetical protein